MVYCIVDHVIPDISAYLVFQASVFSPSCPRHYLNITLPNIVHVFPAGQSVNSPLVYTAETLQK